MRFWNAEKRHFRANRFLMKGPRGSPNCGFWPKRQRRKWSKSSALNKGRMGHPKTNTWWHLTGLERFFIKMTVFGGHFLRKVGLNFYPKIEIFKKRHWKNICAAIICDNAIFVFGEKNWNLTRGKMMKNDEFLSKRSKSEVFEKSSFFVAWRWITFFVIIPLGESL
jgi:hypothetical protein